MEISGSCAVAGIIGWPIEHTRSPRVHNYWLNQYGLDGVYVPLSVEPRYLEKVIPSLTQCGFVGMNVTIPHKESVLDIVDIVDPIAQRIGAINTIVVQPDKSLVGRNTDVEGFITNLYDKIPDWNAASGPAVLFGAGGAAKAAAVALIDEGVPELRVVNRSEDKAQKLRESLNGNIVILSWNQREKALVDAKIVVNATSLGMDGWPALDVNLGRLSSAAIIYDIVYVPLETPLVIQARTNNLRVVDGLGMLLYQACSGFESWFGVKPEVTETLRAHVLADLKTPKQK
tara:strand:+ start:348 stop:1208 length:861 start_codon:yes stop_codon:yes gene_type:complete